MLLVAMETYPPKLSNPVSLACASTASEGFTPSGKQSTIFEQLPSKEVGKGAGGAPGLDDEQQSTSKKSLSNPMTQNGSFDKREGSLHSVSDNIPSWPTGSANLSSHTLAHKISFLWDANITFFPVVFIILAISAAGLSNKGMSEWGEQVIAATRLGPTIFPIIFAALVGRLAKHVARYRVERGATVAVGSPYQKLIRWRF